MLWALLSLTDPRKGGHSQLGYKPLGIGTVMGTQMKQDHSPLHP